MRSVSRWLTSRWGGRQRRDNKEKKWEWETMVFMEQSGRMMMMKSGRWRTGGRKTIFVEHSERESFIWSRLQRRSEHLSAQFILNTTTYLIFFKFQVQNRTDWERFTQNILCFITFITWKISNFIVLSVWVDFTINVFNYLEVYYHYLGFFSRVIWKSL